MVTVLKGIGLYSGGLDSMLAIKLIMDQRCDIELISFVSPFFPVKDELAVLAGYVNINVIYCDITEKFLKIIVSPKHGYGKCLNPCIDCKILMLSEARAYMEETGADFLFTGEVLGQRPMSQNRDAIRCIEKESGLQGRLLRPLSAKLLPPTQIEMQGLIDRDRLLDISGRSRKRQIALAREFQLAKYPTPTGGCLLTDPSFTRKLMNLIHNDTLNRKMIEWLKIGRHFRIADGTRLIVGRDHTENELIKRMNGKENILLQTVAVPGPVAVLLGNASNKNIQFAASLIAGYSDFVRGDGVEIVIGREGAWKQMRVSPLLRNETATYRI